MMEKILRPGLLLLLLVLPAASGIPDEWPPEDDDVRLWGHANIGLPGDDFGLDPARATDPHALMVCDQLYDSLVRYAGDATDIEPGLAASWEVSPDGLAYTFHLRKAVKFHDATDAVADAVVFSLGRLMEVRDVRFFETEWSFPEAPAASEFWDRMGMDEVLGAVEAVDPYTVVLTLRRHDPAFLAKLAMTFAAVVSPAAVLAHGEDFSVNPVGTGPFKLMQWLKGRRIVLEATYVHWPRRPRLHRVVCRIRPDPYHRLLHLKNLNINIYPDPPLAVMAQAEADPKIRLLRQPRLDLAYLGFNHSKPLWQDLRIRRALAHGIDREAIVAKVYQGLGMAAKSALPPLMWGHDRSVSPYPHDPEKARSLLKEARFFEKLAASGRETVTLRHLPGKQGDHPDGRRLGEAIRADLARIGIRVDPAASPVAADPERGPAAQGETDLFLLGWSAEHGDPHPFFVEVADGPAGSSVPVRWGNEAYHEIVREGGRALDRKVRKDLYGKAQALIHREASVIPLAHSMRVWAAHDDIVELELRPGGRVQLSPLVWQR